MLAPLRQPRWVGLVVVVGVASLLFWWLGSWQFGRHQERSERNASVQQAKALPPAPLGTVMPDPARLPTSSEHRSVVVAGRYLAESQTLQRNPRGRSGFTVLTPLLLDQGGTLIVERGFVARAVDDPEAPAADTRPPSAPVQVTVRLRQPQPSTDRVAPAGQVYEIDPTSYPESLPSPVYAAYGELVEQVPPAGDALEPPPPADIGLGPHLFYAIQWWLFIPLAWVGLFALLRREARDGDTPAADAPRPSSVPH